MKAGQVSEHFLILCKPESKNSAGDGRSAAHFYSAKKICNRKKARCKQFGKNPVSRAGNLFVVVAVGLIPAIHELLMGESDLHKYVQRQSIHD